MEGVANQLDIAARLGSLSPYQEDWCASGRAR